MSENPFEDLMGALTNDPQFVAQSVMQDSLAGLLPQMSEPQQIATQKLIAQFARVLDEAGVLRVPEGE